MKKGLLALVVLGAVAGTVAYKLSKNKKEKELLDEELEILSGSEETSEESDETDEEDSDEPDEIEENPEEDSDDVEESTEEVESEETEEIKEYDFSDKFCESTEEHSIDEIISEEIEENPIIHEINDEYKKELESNVDEVIEQLDEKNDLFEDERPIQHTIDFKRIEDMDAYKAIVIEKGYVVTRGETPLQLNVLHIAPINKSELLVNVYYLANQAIKHNGSYQGWQSRQVL